MRFKGLRKIVRRRIRYRITRGGLLFTLALILTGTGAFFSANNLLFLVFSAMLAFILVSGFLSRLVLAGLELELLLPEHVSARTPAEARLRIRNLKRWMPSFSIELAGARDPITRNPPILTEPVYFPLISGRVTMEAPLKVTFPYRGRHRENLFILSTKFPFGFLRKTASVALRRETTVYPALQPDAVSGGALQQAMDDILGEIGADVRGMGTDFYSVRPYEMQDSARNVDWKSTAHTGRLQVREFAREHKRTVEVFLDRYIKAGEMNWFESSVEACAWLLWNLTEEQAEVTFRSQRYSISIPDNGDVYDILRFLATVEPVRTIAGPAATEPPLDDHNYQIVFTSRAEDFSQEGWRTACVLSPPAESGVGEPNGSGADHNAGGTGARSSSEQHHSY